MRAVVATTLLDFVIASCLQGIEEMNRDPVVFRWSKFNLQVT